MSKTDPASAPTPPLLEVGFISRAHGVRGEVRAQLHDSRSEILFAVKRAWFAGVERKIVAARTTSGGVLLFLEGITDRDAAEALRSAKIEVPRTAVKLAPGEFLIADLPGCDVFDEHGAPLGKITDVLAGAQDLLVFRDAEVERMLPLVPEFVISVDVAAKRVVVALPEDLPVTPLSQA